LTGASASPRPNSHQIASAVSTTNTATPSHLLITEPTTMSAKKPIVSQTNRNASASLPKGFLIRAA